MIHRSNRATELIHAAAPSLLQANHRKAKQPKKSPSKLGLFQADLTAGKL
ncbi:hypothetical protein [Rhodocyclus tenuis]|uniref:Uncharacterized protein n=1 Tax=Rhodocyclus tenuis TaxID=1066 RepID=A0A840G4N9_RHOTE|nr:hypothetical protein [Rhodocyclus tenuis]MBB4245708.1 hypothetical protein [Rhodocyclus tenuis]